MKREDGFYWVMVYGRWTIMVWHNYIQPSRIGTGRWLATGDSSDWLDEDFDEINETRLLPPNEQPSAKIYVTELRDQKTCPHDHWERGRCEECGYCPDEAEYE